MRDLLVPVYEPDVVQRPDLRAESSVDAEDLVVDEGRHRHQVEHPAAVAPRVYVAVLGLTLVYSWTKGFDENKLNGEF